jgi:hypothetical protein
LAIANLKTFIRALIAMVAPAMASTCLHLIHEIAGTLKESKKDERPHIAAFPFGASFCLLAVRAHFPIVEM